MKSKLLIKSIALAGILFASAPSFAIDLNISVDPSFLTPGQALQLDYRLITCNNMPVCTISADVTAMSTAMPDDEQPILLNYIKKIFAQSPLPAHSAKDNSDSYIALDIIKDGVRLNLPNCNNVINGMSKITINVLPTGCSFQS